MTKRSKRGLGGTKPTKLTKAVEEAILRHLKTGGYLSHAAEAAGVTGRTLHYWLEWGEEGKKPYAAFAERVMKARAENALRLQSIVTRAALGHIEGDWRSAAWALEKLFPKVYGTAAVQAAAVTVRTGAAHSGEGDDGSVTTVQFYLPDNGRRPQDEDDGAGEGTKA